MECMDKAVPVAQRIRPGVYSMVDDTSAEVAAVADHDPADSGRSISADMYPEADGAVAEIYSDWTESYEEAVAASAQCVYRASTSEEVPAECPSAAYSIVPHVEYP